MTRHNSKKYIRNPYRVVTVPGSHSYKESPPGGRREKKRALRKQRELFQIQNKNEI